MTGNLGKQAEKTGFARRTDRPVGRHALVTVGEALALHPIIEKAPARVFPDGGGEIIAQGTPEEVAANPQSFTGQYLASLLGVTEKRKTNSRK